MVRESELRKVILLNGFLLLFAQSQGLLLYLGEHSAFRSFKIVRIRVECLSELVEMLEHVVNLARQVVLRESVLAQEDGGQDFKGLLFVKQAMDRHLHHEWVGLLLNTKGKLF